MENLLYDIWLNTLTGIGPYLIRNLLEYFATPQNIYSASLSELKQVVGIGPKTANLILDNKALEKTKTLIEYCKTQDIVMASSSNPLYPPILHQYPKAPTLLYVKGDVTPLSFMNTAAIVGARRCSPYGDHLSRATL